MDQKYLSRRKAAVHIQEKGLPCAPSTLAKLASIGGGPKFHKFGRSVIYTAADLDDWVDARLTRAMASTCDRQST